MEKSFVRNKAGMDEDDEEEDIAKDANDWDDRVDAAIEHLVNEVVNLRMAVVTRNVHQHHGIILMMSVMCVRCLLYSFRCYLLSNTNHALFVITYAA